MEQLVCSMPKTDNCWFYKEMFYAFGNNNPTLKKVSQGEFDLQETAERNYFLF